jgi:DNA ligase 1
MQSFAAFLDRLILTPQRNGKIALIGDWLTNTPDPDRGLAIAAISGTLTFKATKASALRELISQRMDAELFAMSYDYVGDLAETIALVWPRQPGANREPDLHEVVEGLRSLTRTAAQAQIAIWLDALDDTGRWALLKLVTGGFRIGAGGRLVRQGIADWGKVDVGEIEELWHGLEPPYEALFAWLEGRGEKPISAAAAPFRPVMLAHPLEDGDLKLISPQTHAAEWKWDGIRVQATHDNGTRKLYSRAGEDISGAFPDLLPELNRQGVIDGELIVLKDGKVAPFGDLQQRLNRKTVSARMMADYPVAIRAYDILFDDTEDTRGLPTRERRARLEAFVSRLASPRIDVSPLVPFDDVAELAAFRADPPEVAAEGLMLKRWDAPYLPGRPKGLWWKWKREPMVIDAVLMYAQRGHGRRSSLYSDFTFGVWKGEEITPVGKAYFGFTDAELKDLDKFVRDNTIDRFGPVRSVVATREKGLVLEIAFEGLQRSTRHKSGVAMRFPRISRIRWDKPSAEADTLETLERLLP